MAQLFEDEKKYPDNAPRKNFVFLAYPFTPPISLDDYNAVIRELQSEFPLRLWYFLDDVTTQELMRKIWRAILRSDFCIFDITKGNPTAGSYKVRITWDKKTGKKVSTGDADSRDETKQVLPAKFNTDSTLTAEVKASSPVLDFELKGN
jgi:hypothetical protein